MKRMFITLLIAFVAFAVNAFDKGISEDQTTVVNNITVYDSDELCSVISFDLENPFNVISVTVDFVHNSDAVNSDIVEVKEEVRGSPNFTTYIIPQNMILNRLASRRFLTVTNNWGHRLSNVKFLGEGILSVYSYT